MADYTAREWSNGDIVTAANLNQIENGIEDAGSGSWLVVNAARDNNNGSLVLDRTWQEIYNAFPMVYLCSNEDDFSGKTFCTDVGNDGEMYIVQAWIAFITNSPNGYPSTGSSSPAE